jgi:hypothetical protein
MIEITPVFNTILISILAAVSGVISPLLMAWLTNRNAARMKVADYKRQDAVAEQLRIRQDEIARKADEASGAALRLAQVQGAKIDQIHTLVNSNLSAAMQDQFDARSATLALLKAVSNPSNEVLGQIDANKAKIAELSKELADRKAQTQTAAKQLAVDLEKKV